VDKGRFILIGESEKSLRMMWGMRQAFILSNK